MNSPEDYEQACDILAVDFLDSLYKKDEYPHDQYWVGDISGEVLAWGDWFVNMTDIANYFGYKLTAEEFFDWYNQRDDKDGVNMKYFKTHGKLNKAPLS